jgi:ATP-dependent Clp protease protease subunit
MEEIWMDGEFNNIAANKLRVSILQHASEGKDRPIVIYINSYGGSVDSLNCILDTLDSLPNKIITVCAGTAMSCGAVLLAYGDERYIGQNSRVMIHQISSIAFGNLNELKNEVGESKRMNDQIVRILAKKSKKSIKEIKDIFGKNLNEYLTAYGAIKHGLADKVGVPRLKTVSNYILE